MYCFTFTRNNTGSNYAALVQRVTVTAACFASAWALFEALYPPKRFTAFSCTNA